VAFLSARLTGLPVELVIDSIGGLISFVKRRSIYYNNDMSTNVIIRPITETDRTWVREFIRQHWGEPYVVVHETVYYPEELPGYCAHKEGRVVGLITYHIAGQECEIVSLDAVVMGAGIGSMLIDTLREEALKQNCTRLWLITSNDNLSALRFYQRRGFVFSALYPRAVEKARLLKPAIPLIGEDGIPIRDELELEYQIGDIS